MFYPELSRLNLVVSVLQRYWAKCMLGRKLDFNSSINKSMRRDVRQEALGSADFGTGQSNRWKCMEGG